MESKFYKCGLCGKIITIVKDTGVPTVCCGQEMEEIIPGSKDASLEKHVPVVNIENNKVTVTIGAVEHPMSEEHFIEWITIVTKNGTQTKSLNPSDSPKAEFLLSDQDEFIVTYAYCNLHGLWEYKKER